MNNDKTTCDPQCEACEEMFEENIRHLVDEARPPRGAEHDARKKEIDAAFGQPKQPHISDRGNHPLGDMPEQHKA